VDALWRLDSSLLFPPPDVPALSLPGALVVAGFLLAAGVFRLRRASAATAVPFLPTPRSFRPDRSPPTWDGRAARHRPRLRGTGIRAYGKLHRARGDGATPHRSRALEQEIDLMRAGASHAFAPVTVRCDVGRLPLRAS
jgi:hypothetical protein